MGKKIISNRFHEGKVNAPFLKIFASITSAVNTLEASWEYNISDTENEGVDQGPPQAEFNDHDGSRNDIGANGGHKFDPEGWTTDNPRSYL